MILSLGSFRLNMNKNNVEANHLRCKMSFAAKSGESFRLRFSITVAFLGDANIPEILANHGSHRALEMVSEQTFEPPAGSVDFNLFFLPQLVFSRFKKIEHITYNL